MASSAPPGPLCHSSWWRKGQSRASGLCRAHRAALPVSPTDAVLLNNIVQNFGMLDLVKKVLAGHKCQMDRSREQYARDLAGACGPRVQSRPHRTAALGGRLALSAGSDALTATVGGQSPVQSVWCPS